MWCFLFALIAATMQLSRFGSDTALARSIFALGTISGAYAGYRWARNESWPTWRQSVAFVVWADLWDEPRLARRIHSVLARGPSRGAPRAVGGRP